MNRLPMGLRVAPELLHTVTAVVGGAPGYSAAPAETDVAVFIDNIRHAGSRTSVAASMRAVDNRAAAAGAQWKAADTRDLVVAYPFLGVLYDHETKTLRLPASFLRKTQRFLDAAEAGSVRVVDIDAYVGRIVHGTLVMGVPLGEWWFLLKRARRVQSMVSAGRVGLDDAIPVAPAFVAEARRLQEALAGARRWCPVQLGDAWEVYTDASTDGWGVVARSAVHGIHVTGGKWPPEMRTLHINVLEALVLNEVAALLQPFRVSFVNLFIDNTSVAFAVRNGYCAPSAAMNTAAVSYLTWLQQKGATGTVAYVRSAANPADGPSRGVFDTVVQRLDELRPQHVQVLRPRFGRRG
eukprot:TRINITY_DN5876_c0_g4_i1.p1 TRINITY_DN5876_c0_g4~~TRINITY_DN5876_c0_g4_i1.p1  ORF type:complete len:352 (-),score=27.45 TRINITY_DN5876_c0_g4_i1:270-1325(-)